MSAPKLFQFPNTVTVDLNVVYKVSHVYFRFHTYDKLESGKAYYIKLFVRADVSTDEQEFYLCDDEADATRVHDNLIYRWGQEK